MTHPDLDDLLGSWEVHLRAERKAPGTIMVYLGGVKKYLSWCAENELPAAIDRQAVTEWTADLLDEYDAGTVISRRLAVRRFSAWLTDQGEIDADPLLGMKPPKVDQKVVEPLTVDQLQALFKACAGKTFRDLRDLALARVIAETGMRAGEAVLMTIPDTDIRAGAVIIRRGKGGKGRRVPIGPQTCVAIDRYLRKRRGHRLAHTDTLWLGDGGKGFRYDALRRALTGRAEAAGIEGFHVHRLRHTMADRWLDAGGTESGLMAVAGWSRPEMLQRYTRARAEARASDEAKRLNLGEI